jgi:hypothetical protein
MLNLNRLVGCNIVRPTQKLQYGKRKDKMMWNFAYCLVLVARSRSGVIVTNARGTALREMLTHVIQ